MRSFLKTALRAAAASLVLATTIATDAAAPNGGHVLKDATFHFRARDGSVLTLLMLEFLAVREGGPAYAGVASIEETDRRGQAVPGVSPWKVPLERAKGHPGPGRAAFVGRAYLQPGRIYMARYVLTSATEDEILLKNALIVVPYLSGGFSASSVVPAERYGPASSEAGPFHVGSEEVVPKAGGTFKRSELLRLYLQVYDAVVDPVTSQPSVDVEFRFYRLVAGVSKRQGKPYSMRGAAGASLGLALPIGDWPAGSYRVVVELHDRRSAARTSTEGAFSVVED